MTRLEHLEFLAQFAWATYAQPTPQVVVSKPPNERHFARVAGANCAFPGASAVDALRLLVSAGYHTLDARLSATAVPVFREAIESSMGVLGLAIQPAETFRDVGLYRTDALGNPREPARSN